MVLLQVDPGLTVVDTVVFGVLLATLWVWGAWLRTLAAARSARARDAEREAIAAERARIARELHDVVTHHVTAIVTQADAAQFRSAVDDETRTTLASIAAGGRETLVDLRSMLGALEATTADSREPALQSLAEVIARARSTGQTVSLQERGPRRPLVGAAGLAVVRVVQESVTNARKHARDGAAEVAVEYAEDAILITVTSSGRGVSGQAVHGGGRGIIGMRERVESLGGELRTESGDGRFIVQARIPA